MTPLVNRSSADILGRPRLDGGRRLRAALRQACDDHGLDRDAALGLAADALLDRLETDGAAREDAALAREARHRAANQLQFVLSSLRQRAREAEGATASAGCASCVGQVGALTSLNDVVRNGGSMAEADVSHVLGSVCRLFADALADDRVRIETDLEPVRTSSRSAEALAIAVNEALTNCVKHAFPDGRAGVVRVTLRPIGERAVEVTVADDGVGADPEKPPSGEGCRLIERILSSRGGALRRLPAARGYAVRFELPLSPDG